MAEAIGVGITIFFIALLVQEFWPLLIIGLAALVAWLVGTALSNAYPFPMHVGGLIFGYALICFFFVLPPCVGIYRGVRWMLRHHGWLTVVGSAETTPRPAKVGDVN